MRLHFQRIFDNPLSKYPISKLLECIGYIIAIWQSYSSQSQLLFYFRFEDSQFNPYWCARLGLGPNLIMGLSVNFWLNKKSAMINIK